ncbi:MAG: Hpt domain-containing protein [Pseudomonadota bacterium]
MIDWDRIAELRDEVGEDDFAEVLEMFFAEVDETLAGLRGANDAALKNGLHFLKGAALNIGMAEVSGLCLAGEKGLADGKAPDLSAIAVALETSQAEMREMLA